MLWRAGPRVCAALGRGRLALLPGRRRLAGRGLGGRGRSRGRHNAPRGGHRGGSRQAIRAPRPAPRLFPGCRRHPHRRRLGIVGADVVPRLRGGRLPARIRARRPAARRAAARLLGSARAAHNLRPRRLQRRGRRRGLHLRARTKCSANASAGSGPRRQPRRPGPALGAATNEKAHVSRAGPRAAGFARRIGRRAHSAALLTGWRVPAAGRHLHARAARAAALTPSGARPEPPGQCGRWSAGLEETGATPCRCLGSVVIRVLRPLA